MNINEGNIFEAMRLVLPEHRGIMKEWQRQRGARKPPVLSEDEVEQMRYILSEAIEECSRIRVTLFRTHGDTVLEGVPIFEGQLRIATGLGVQSVDVERMIKVEIV